MANKILFQSKFKTLSFVILCLSLSFACATTEPAAENSAGSGRGSPKTITSKKPKPGAEAGKGAPAGTGSTTVPLKPAQPAGDELTSFVARAGVSSGPFTEQDRQMLGLVSTKPQAGSIQEAALALGVIRTVYNPATAQPTKFVETDLGNGLTANRAGEQPSETRSELELEAGNKGIDIASALEQNSFMQTEDIFQMTLAALAVGAPASDAYSQRLKGVMAQKVRTWIKFGEMNSLLPKEVPQTPTPLITDQAPPQAPVADKLTDQLNAAQPSVGAPPQTGDVKDAESLLTGAQALSDRGEYDAAIAQVSRISPESPQYAASLEKLKQFSNRAVHSLRTKAAQAYTSAAPVNDAKTRASYLERARTYLQEALSKYPAADQLATVRDNLAVITRDLAKLTQDGSGQDGSAPK